MYIGTTKYDPQQRWKEHVNRYNQLLKQGDLKYPIYLAFNKYGIENFNIETIEECEESEMFNQEKYYVKLYNTYGADGYNATTGGGGTPRLTEEDKQEIIDAYLQYRTIAETRRQTGRNAETIHNVLCQYGINTNSFLTDEMLNEIVALFKNGIGVKEIADKYDCSQDTIIKQINKRGLFTYRQLWRNNIIYVDEKHICDLYDNGQTISEIVNHLKPEYPYVYTEMVTKILANNGYCTSRFLNDNLCLDDVVTYYQETKSIKQTAQHFNVTRRAMTNFLNEHNISLNSKNCATEVSIFANGKFICFQNLMECAKFVQQNYLQEYTSIRGIRDNISKAIRNNGMYADLYFFDGDKSMVKIKQTEDVELLNEIIRQLEENNYICPCSVRADPQKDKCMCETFREVINTNIPGTYECHCGRFIATIAEDLNTTK